MCPALARPPYQIDPMPLSSDAMSFLCNGERPISSIRGTSKLRPVAALATAFFLLVSLSRDAACDWLEFRGGNGDGVVARNDLPVRWGGLFRQPVWSTPIPGQGWSSPIVIGDSIWLSSAEVTALPDALATKKLVENQYGPTDFQTHGTVALLAIELNATDGSVVRTIALGKIEKPVPIHSMNSYASPTPCSDGERIVFHFGTLGTYCIRSTGELLWQLRFELDDITGPATSPILRNGLVYLACDGTDHQYVAAVDVQSGQEKWRTPRPPIDTARGAERRAFSTPLIIEHKGLQQLLSPCAQWLVSYDPIRGNENWRCRIGSGHALVPRVVYQDGVAFACSGYMRPELFAIQVGGHGDVSETHVKWSWKRQVPEVASPALIGDSICFVSSMGIATCLSQRDGVQRWQERLPGSYAASPTVTGGLVYFTNQSGVTTVIRPGNQMETVAVNELFGETLASFAVHNDAFLIRTHPLLHYVRRTDLD